MYLVTAPLCIMSELIARLHRGETIVYPTETCYGLGCDATNAEAVKNIYAIKGRPDGKPLIVIVDSLDQMAPYIDITPTLRDVEKKYWPGALTVVVPAKAGAGLAPGVVGPDGTVAFRVTSHPFARELAATLGRPLVSSSANLAGEPNVYAADVVTHIFEQQKIQPDIVVDAGALPLAAPSTVVRFDGDTVVVLRQGDIVIESGQ